MPDYPNLGDRPVNAFANFAAIQAIPVSQRVIGKELISLAPICVGGAPGIKFVWDGTLFRFAGMQKVFSTIVDVVSGGPTTTEQVMRSVLFQTGVLFGARAFRAQTQFVRSVVDPALANIAFRLGPSGNATDGLIATSTFAAGNLRIDYATRRVPLSSTALDQRSIGFDQNSESANPVPAPASTSNMETLALFLSATITQGASPAATITNRYLDIFVE